MVVEDLLPEEKGNLEGVTVVYQCGLLEDGLEGAAVLHCELTALSPEALGGNADGDAHLLLFIIKMHH